jgi:formylglycine-generating enzyme required for sulfatase activity
MTLNFNMSHYRYSGHPALVQAARMPRSTDLPDVLRMLARRNAHDISERRFHYDVDRLIEVLEMAGNVREWTRSLWGKSAERPDYRYPYRSTDGRENPDAGRVELRVLRGGAFEHVRRACGVPLATRTTRAVRSGTSGFGWWCAQLLSCWRSGL